MMDSSDYVSHASSIQIRSQNFENIHHFCVSLLSYYYYYYSKLTKIWCASQSKLPTNIFNFTVERRTRFHVRTVNSAKQER